MHNFKYQMEERVAADLLPLVTIGGLTRSIGAWTLGRRLE
jgi:hypothetical protein